VSLELTDLGYVEVGDNLVTLAMNGWGDADPLVAQPPDPSRRHGRAEGVDTGRYRRALGPVQEFLRLHRRRGVAFRRQE
jgi:hypothetical protein